MTGITGPKYEDLDLREMLEIDSCGGLGQHWGTTVIVLRTVDLVGDPVVTPRIDQRWCG